MSESGEKVESSTNSCTEQKSAEMIGCFPMFFLLKVSRLAYFDYLVVTSLVQYLIDKTVFWLWFFFAH